MKLLAAVDLSKASSYIIEAVHRVALATDAQVILIYVEEPLPSVPGPSLEAVSVYPNVADGELATPKQLEILVQQLNDLGVSTKALISQGDPARTILEEAKGQDADLIIVGSHGHGLLFDALVGSVSSYILRHSPVPVLVVPVRGL